MKFIGNIILEEIQRVLNEDNGESVPNNSACNYSMTPREYKRNYRANRRAERKQARENRKAQRKADREAKNGSYAKPVAQGELQPMQPLGNPNGYTGMWRNNSIYSTYRQPNMYYPNGYTQQQPAQQQQTTAPQQTQTNNTTQQTSNKAVGASYGGTNVQTYQSNTKVPQRGSNMPQTQSMGNRPARPVNQQRPNRGYYAPNASVYTTTVNTDQNLEPYTDGGRAREADGSYRKSGGRYGY